LPIVAEKEYTYPVRSEGELKGNSYIVFSYHLGDYGDEEIYDCGNILYSLLLSENSSVLKSALLRSGLCRDVNAFMTTEYQRSLSIVIYKTEGAKKAELERVINDTLTDLVKNGIDENALKAVLAEYTFSMKEKSAALKKRALDGFFTVADNVFFNTPLTKYLEDNDEIVQKNGEYFLARAFGRGKENGKAVCGRYGEDEERDDRRAFKSLRGLFFPPRSGG
jgi:Zn-dependent M16 (insulinase) family peptidase